MKLRIHGDNIIECERALKLIVHSYKGILVSENKSIIVPSYVIKYEDNKIIKVELFGGHNRWNIDINTELSKYGAPLREATDVYITKLKDDNNSEELLVAIEFCNALPAGNNAWQRNGRAITCAEIGVPYFYFAEIGGVELDSNRKVKAPRFPNPIVPFSYLTTSRNFNVICVPVYEAHPAISGELIEKFMPVFGTDTCMGLLKSIINRGETKNEEEMLIEKGITLVKLLSENRKRRDTFHDTEWEDFLKLSSGQKKSEWIKKHPNRKIWKKKVSSKVPITKSFDELLTKTQNLNLLSVGSKTIPICLVVNGNIKNFSTLLKEIYPPKIINKLANQIEKKNKPLLIVWITGFKPKGDDSRPDRGLVPLARMLFGNDIDILTIVYGPARKHIWNIFRENSSKLAKNNGLWQSILNLSNYVLADSITSEYGALTKIISQNLKKKSIKVTFNAAKSNSFFGEHEVDTAIHILFSRQHKANVFESMCNPPGGDWSGISFFDFSSQTEYRWTSLPRVSANFAKRPDHIIQIHHENVDIFLTIESKNKGKDLEKKIGRRLIEYVETFIGTPPTAHKLNKQEWQLFKGKQSPIKNFSLYSGGAFIYKNLKEMETKIQEGKLDFIFAFEFNHIKEDNIVHILLTKKCQFLNRIFTHIFSQYKSSIKIKIY